MTTEELGRESIKHSEQLKTVFKQLETLNEKFDAIEGLALSVQKLAISVEQIAKNQSEDRETQKDIVKQIAILESAPSKDKASKYDRVTNQIASIIIGAVVGYLLKSLIGI